MAWALETTETGRRAPKIRVGARRGGGRLGKMLRVAGQNRRPADGKWEISDEGGDHAEPTQLLKKASTTFESYIVAIPVTTP